MVMDFKNILVRYGEIGTKSKTTLKRFENILKNNIEYSFKKKGISCNVDILHRRLLITFDNAVSKKEIDILKKIPGIVSFSPVLICDKDIDSIKNTSFKLFIDCLKKYSVSSFAVKTQRVKKDFSLTSPEINRFVGSYIISKIDDINDINNDNKNNNINNKNNKNVDNNIHNKNNKISNSSNKIKVDLKNPDLTIGIEIIDKGYIYTEKYEGVGGLPVGTQGKVIVLLSDGIDSPVSAYLMIKRGCSCVFLHLKTSDKGYNKVKKIYDILNEYDPYSQLITIEFKETLRDIVKKLKSIKKERYTCLICKRSMLKIGQNYCKKYNCYGITTGDNLGQVASQTLKNIMVISYGIDYPIFRPLIGLDKNEIIKISKSIGTYDISTSEEIKCFATPKYPITNGDLEEVLKIEQEININIDNGD